MLESFVLSELLAKRILLLNFHLLYCGLVQPLWNILAPRMAVPLIFLLWLVTDASRIIRTR